MFMKSADVNNIVCINAVSLKIKLVPRNALFVAKAPEEVRLLRTAGADLEARNPAGETPLLASDSEDVILALLDAGADRNARDADGKSIHDKAARKRSSMPRVLAWLSAHPRPGQAVVRQGKLGLVSDPFSVAARNRDP